MVVRAPHPNQLAFRLPDTGIFMDGELVIDSFAGAGGVSLAMEQVFGRSPDIAINHNKIALDTHALNHPNCRHIRENIWKVDPARLIMGRPVGLFWASPDCTHFSKAKGGKPVKQRIRGLANIVVKWAKETRPRVIGMENVEEFMTWGPLKLMRKPNGEPLLDVDGRRQFVPDKARAGEYFRSWKAALEKLGYRVEHRIIVAADFGAPTSRKRFFLMARRDGRSIRWPEKTHGPGTGQAYRMAADCIDFSLPCPSIFERKRPLRPATLRRIALGVVRYVVDDPNPFLIKVNHAYDQFRGQRVTDPLATVTHKNGFGLVAPTIMTQQRGHRGRKLSEPLPTQLSGQHHTLVGASMIQTGWGERKGQKPRTLNIRKPIGSLMAQGVKQGFVAAFLNKHNGGVVGQRVRKSLGTITKVDHHSLGAVHLTKFRSNCKSGKSVRPPIETICTGKGGAGGHFGLVSAFLAKYNGTAIGQRADESMHTVTSKARFGVVLVNIDGQEYAIGDIGMRMLQPRELARAHDFPEGYFLIGTKEQQVAMIGNSVPWKPAAAILRANFEEEAQPLEAIA